MKIVIAPDKFKGSLSSFAVCDAIEKGLRQASSSFQLTKLPMADGGEGLAEVIRYYTQASVQTATVQDPLGRPVPAKWLLSSDGKTAFIEMAKASGLGLLKKDEYNPLLTSTFGTGQLIEAAVQSGVENIVLGIGGSATTDGGTGMAAALGYRFLDGGGNALAPIGESLIHLKKIIPPDVCPFRNIRFQVACDVKNVLYGGDGAAKVYGPQKGADAAMAEALDRGLMNYAGVVKKDLGIDVSTLEGGGAAGGLGAGSVAFLHAELLSGAKLVMQYANVEESIRETDAVITGEGKTDGQTLQGKLVAVVSGLAARYGKPVVVFCGSNEIDASRLKEANIGSVFSILDKAKDWQDAVANASAHLTALAFAAASDWLRKGSHL